MESVVPSLLFHVNGSHGSEAWSNGQRSRFRYGRFRVRTFLLPLISLWGSLAGPCNPMRLGHDCYNTQVRSVISCIRKGKNEVTYSGTKDRLTIPLTAWRDRTLLLPRNGASNKVTCLSLSRGRGTKKKVAKHQMELSFLHSY